MPKTFVSDKGPEFVSDDHKQWCEPPLGIKEMGSPVCHPRAKELAERAVQTVKLGTSSTESQS